MKYFLYAWLIVILDWPLIAVEFIYLGIGIWVNIWCWHVVVPRLEFSPFVSIMMERADSSQKLYTSMRLWEFPDQYVVEPTDGSSGSFLAISRNDGSMNLIGGMILLASLSVVLRSGIVGISCSSSFFFFSFLCCRWTSRMQLC